jgi:hypothetical protein
MVLMTFIVVHADYMYVYMAHKHRKVRREGTPKGNRILGSLLVPCSDMRELF